MMTFADIVTVVRTRQQNQSIMLQKMIEVRQRYNADYIVPWSSDDDQPDQGLAMPLLITESIDGNAMRAASIMPNVTSPAIRLAKENGKESRRYADIRTKAYSATWRESRLNLGLRRAYRHIAGYATTALVVVPDFDSHIPKIEVRDPLTCYPSPRSAEDLSPPENCAFVYGKSADWIRMMYPEARQENGGPCPKPTGQGMEDMWDVVEWIDADHIVIGILGLSSWDDRESPYHTPGNGLGGIMELRRWKNLAGRCTAIIPRRVTMDRITSQISNIVGTYDLMAKLTQLHVAATEKSIFPDRYILGGDNITPRLIGGEWQDGRDGGVNLIQGARDVGELRSTPDPTNLQLIDRLERGVRAGGGLNAAMMGETAGALRTGRGIDSMMAASVDPRVQEMQEIMEVALEDANVLIVDTYKGYWPNRKYQMFSGRRADGEQFEFTPNVHFETTANSVSYAIAGTDVQGATIILGQMEGAGMISRHLSRKLHPWVDDPEGERRRIDEEQLERAAAEALMQQAVGGEVPITYLIKVEKHIKAGKDTLAAIDAADKELKAEQAAAPQPEAPPGMEGMPPGMEGMPPGGNPAGMPGIAPPGAVPATPGTNPELPAAAVPGSAMPEKKQLEIRSLMNAMSQEPVEVG